MKNTEFGNDSELWATCPLGTDHLELASLNVAYLEELFKKSWDQVPSADHDRLLDMWLEASERYANLFRENGEKHAEYMFG